MKLHYLQYQLNTRNISATWNLHKTRDFSGYCLCRKEEQTNPDLLRIEVPTHPEEGILRIDLPGCGWADIKGIPLSTLSECLNHIFSDYEKWTFARENASEINLSSLLEVAGDLLQTAIVIINNEYRYIARNLAGKQMFPWEYVAEDEVARLTWEKDFYAIQNYRTNFIYPSADGNPDMICHNIFLNDTYYARLIAFSTEQEVSATFMDLFQEISTAVEKCMNGQGAQFWKKHKNQEFLQEIEQLLDHKIQAESGVLSRYGWMEQHEYQVIRLRIFDQYPITTGGEYLLHKIEANFADCCVLKRENDYVCIRNLSLSYVKDLQRNLAPFLRENLIKAGISNTFTGLSHLAVYDMETIDALTVGTEQDPDFWYFRFKDYTFDILLKYGSSRYPFKELLHPAIFILKDYDAAHHTELLDTLKLYLKLHENASRTAQDLNIQRSSLLKRLNRIEELSGIQIAKDHLYLQLSCYLEDHPS